MRFSNRGWNYKFRSFAAIVGLVAVMEIYPSAAFAQTTVTGAIIGTVSDSSGAVVPKAAVTVKDESTGATLNLVTNGDGRYLAPLLKPDKFDVSATAQGLQSTTTTVQVLTGQQSVVNLTVTPTASSQTVQVSASDAQLIDTQTANLTTTFTTEQFQNLPLRVATSPPSLTPCLAWLWAREQRALGPLSPMACRAFPTWWSSMAPIITNRSMAAKPCPDLLT